MNVYQVKDWSKNFEGAKSKDYNNKSSCQMPTKHGLGYRKLIRQKDGAALFGAWCALVQVLSKQPKPRQGYLTDTGLADGSPYTASDLELLTDIPAILFERLLQVAANEQVGWLRILQGQCADTALLPQGGIDLDLNSDLNSNSNPQAAAVISATYKGNIYSSREDLFDRLWADYGKIGNKKKAQEYWRKLSENQIGEICTALPDYLAVCAAGRTKKDFQGWINPLNQNWKADWRAVLREWTKKRPAISQNQSMPMGNHREGVKVER